jgi:PAS domain-containing protein
MADEATILINADGTYADASPLALKLLGVKRDELLAMGPGSFSVEPPDAEASRALREAWQGSGAPDIGGETTIMRGDGTKARLRFVITVRDDGSYLAMIESASGELDRPASIFTLGDVLSKWRAAERRMDALEVGGEEWQAVQSEIASLRDRYQKAFAARARAEKATN